LKAKLEEMRKTCIKIHRKIKSRRLKNGFVKQKNKEVRFRRKGKEVNVRKRKDKSKELWMLDIYVGKAYSFLPFYI
jgi:hypothetical protein